MDEPVFLIPDSRVGGSGSAAGLAWRCTLVSSRITKFFDWLLCVRPARPRACSGRFVDWRI